MISPKDRERISALFRLAREQKRLTLLETEGLEILKTLGIATPLSLFVKNADEVHCLDLSCMPGDKIVLKVVSKDILHKTELGGVRIIPKNSAQIHSAIADIHERLASKFEVTGYSINEKVAFEAAFGSELLVSLRWTEDFGPILTVGAGGTNAEFLGAALKPSEATAIIDPRTSTGSLPEALRSVAAVRYAALPQRGRAPLIQLDTVQELLERFFWLARDFGSQIADFEVNPFVITTAESPRLVALDALVKLREIASSESVPRPLAKLSHLLSPATIAIMGVSEKMNPGRVILKNTLAQGFSPEKVFVIKPGSETLDGCRCVPDLASLPFKVDLLVLAVSATQAGDALTQAIETQKTESVVLIPGGLEEKAGNEALVAQMKASLQRARQTPWGGPVINGGNCLGVRSVPGRINTLFIPETKLPLHKGPADPLAIISQSGAFSICRLSKLGAINPRYTLSIGNQMDLSVSDYLEFLEEDREIAVFAVYVEGFKPLDGRRFLDISRKIVRSGRPVILYSAGRTAAGAAATASHTASIAGNWEVTRQLCESAGVIVAESIDEFEDLSRISLKLGDTPLGHPTQNRPGARLGAISNAGFECVGFADNLGQLWLPELSSETVSRIVSILDQARISGLVDIHNPLDLTPMANDAVFDSAVKALLEDSSVDCAVVGCVPLTPAIDHDANAPESLARRLSELRKHSQKPFVVVIDSGALYDGMSAALESAGIPVFRTADRALRILDRYCAWRLTHAP